MNFVLTQDQEAIRKTVQEFTAKRIAPGAAERDEKDIFPRDIYNEMGKLGLMGIPYPEEYGGAGLDFVAYALAVEEISKADAGIGIGRCVKLHLFIVRVAHIVSKTCRGRLIVYGDSAM